MATSPSASDLASQKCLPCEGGVPKMSHEEANVHLSALPEWQLSDDGTRIQRDWQLTTFRDGIRLINNVGALAEREQHHPDLHLVSYRQVCIELTTHAIGGLSMNDFILAAKIDAIAPPSTTK